MLQDEVSYDANSLLAELGFVVTYIASPGWH